MNENDYIKSRLDDIYVAQVLLLAQGIQHTNALKGSHTDLSGCVQEAMNALDALRGQILARNVGTR